MNSKLETEGNRTTIYLSGKIIGPDSKKMSKIFKSLIKNESKEIVVELSNIIFFDSNFLGSLLYYQTLFKKHNKKIILSGPNKHLTELFSDCSFDKLFEII